MPIEPELAVLIIPARYSGEEVSSALRRVRAWPVELRAGQAQLIRDAPLPPEALRFLTTLLARPPGGARSRGAGVHGLVELY